MESSLLPVILLLRMHLSFRRMTAMGLRCYIRNQKASHCSIIGSYAKLQSQLPIWLVLYPLSPHALVHNGRLRQSHPTTNTPTYSDAAAGGE